MRNRLDDTGKNLDKIGKKISQRQTSKFYELVPCIGTGDMSHDTKGRVATESAELLLSKFHRAIKFKFPDHAPFSILPCILGLPEKLSDWESPKQLAQVLSMLLADCGFLFAEVRPVPAGQLFPQDFIAALDKGNHILDMVCMDETFLISEVQRRLWDKYRIPGDDPNYKPSVLKQLESIADRDSLDWFRQCAIELFHLSYQTGSIETISLDFIAHCKKKWGLTPDNLYEAVLSREYIDSPNAEKKPDRKEPTVTLNDALKVLFDIWNDLVAEYKSQTTKVKQYGSISKDAYKRYKMMDRTMRQIQKDLKTQRFLFFNMSSST